MLAMEDAAKFLEKGGGEVAVSRRYQFLVSQLLLIKFFLVILTHAIMFPVCRPRPDSDLREGIKQKRI